MQPLQYLQTTTGIIWMCICLLLGFALTFAGYFIINSVPAKWLCDYNETPSPELLSGKRVDFKKSGIVLSIISAVCFMALRLQFNKGYDIYFILLVLIVFVSLMITVCDFKYTIIPDQFTIALGVLSLIISVYDIVRNYNIFHSTWWSPIAGALIGGAVMLAIDFLGMLIYKKDGMGFGDVKLFFSVGILTGFPGTIYALIISLITASVCFVFVITAAKIKNRGAAAEETQNGDDGDTEAAPPYSEDQEPITDGEELTENGAENEKIGIHSYLAFGPYIAISVIAYAALFDLIKYLVNMYLNLF